MKGKREKLLTAYHEAGHVICSWLIGERPLSAHIWDEAQAIVHNASGTFINQPQPQKSSFVEKSFADAGGIAAEFMLMDAPSEVHRTAGYFSLFRDTFAKMHTVEFQRLTPPEMTDEEIILYLAAYDAKMKWMLREEAAVFAATAITATAIAALQENRRQLTTIAEILIKDGSIDGGRIARILAQTPQQWTVKPIDMVRAKIYAESEKFIPGIRSMLTAWMNDTPTSP